MSCQASKRHERTLNVPKWREPRQSLHTVWFQLYDIREKAELWRQQIRGWRWGDGWVGRARGTLGAVKMVWCHHDGYVSLCIYGNPWNAQHQEWTVMVNSRPAVIMLCQCRFVDRNGYTALGVGMLIMGEASHKGVEGTWAVPVLSPPLCCELKTVRIKS